MVAPAEEEVKAGKSIDLAKMSERMAAASNGGYENIAEAPADLAAQISGSDKQVNFHLNLSLDEKRINEYSLGGYDNVADMSDSVRESLGIKSPDEQANDNLAVDADKTSSKAASQRFENVNDSSHGKGCIGKQKEEPKLTLEEMEQMYLDDTECN